MRLLKYILLLALVIPQIAIGAVAVPLFATTTSGTIFASPTRINNINPVLMSQYFFASSTKANWFPYASSTALSATWLCLGTDCRNVWPAGGTSASSTLLIDSNTFTGTNLFATTTIGALNGTLVVDGTHYAQTSTGINKAIAQCGANGVGAVYLPPATYTINSRISPVSNCHVYGAGKGITILQGSVSSDWVFYYNSATQLVNFSLSDLTIDLQSGTAASGVQLSNASTTVLQNLDFRNGAASGWFVVYGVNGSSATAAVQNFNNKIIDVDFTNHLGTLEALLVYNATSTQIVRPVLQNITSPGIGLWQKTYNTNVDDLYCKDSSGAAFYYSISTEDTTVNNPKSDNCSTLVQGANISDNGEFGLTQAQNLTITHPIAVGGPKSKTTFAIQLGAVNNAHVIDPQINNYDIGISVNTGNNSALASTTNWSIIGGSIRNNNAENTASLLHPAIILSGTIGGGAPVYGLISGVKMYDDQATPLQKYPIVLDGNAVFDHVSIANNRLSAPASLGGTSIALGDGATLGTNVQIYANDDYSGSSPAQTFSINNGNLGVGATSTPGSLFSINGIANFSTGTSSIYSGINITSGCFSINNVCIGNGSSLATPVSILNGGTATTTFQNNGVIFSNGTTLTQDLGAATGFFWNSVLHRLGVASSSPDSGVSIDNFTGRALLHVGDDSTNNSETKLLIENRWTGAGGFGLIVQKIAGTPQFVVDGTGFVGIDMSAPSYALDVTGKGHFTGLVDALNFVATSTSVASTFGSSIGIATTTPAAALGVQGNMFIAGNITSTSTLANIFPYASTTAITATTASTTNLIVSSAGGTAGCATFSSNGTISNTGTACGTGSTSAGSAFNFGTLTFGTSTAATSTSILTQGVFFSSSTAAASQLPYASSTGLTVGNLFASGSTIVSAANGITVDAGSNNLSIRGGGGNFALLNTSAVSPSHTYTFPNSSGTFCLTTTCITSASTLGTTSPWTVGQLAYVADDSHVTSVATTSIGCSGNISCTGFSALGSASTVAFTGTLPIANGGTNQTAYVTTGGLIFYDGTRLTQSSTGDPFYDQANGRLVMGKTAANFRLETSGSSGNGYFGIESASSKTTGDVFIVDPSGNVGIATTTPAAKFAIQGNEFIAGNITSTSTTASIFPYASTTAITASVASTSLFYANGLGCPAGQYTTWSAGAFGCAADQTSAGASPFSFGTLTFSTSTAATSTSIWLNGGAFFSSSTVASQIPYASTTELSASSIDVENSSGGSITLGDNGANVNQTFFLKRNGAVVGGLSTSNSTMNFFGGTAVSNTNTLIVRNGPQVAIGVSTNAAPSMFQVAGNTALGAGYAMIFAAPTNGLIVQGNVGFGTTTPGQALAIQGDEFIAGRITSTSTLANIFPYASSTMQTFVTASTTNLIVSGPGTTTFANGIDLVAGTGCFSVAGTCLQQTILGSSAYKQAVKYASTSTLPANTYNNGSSGVGATITGTVLAPLFIDGNAAVLGDRILVKNEGTGANNGIYTVTTAGVAGVTAFVLTRATDYNSSLDVFPGVANFVNSGTTNANTCWILTNTSAVTIGTTALTYDDACGAGSYTGSSPIVLNGTNITFVAPATSALSIPYASSTAASAQFFCLTGDICRSTWPTSGNSGIGDPFTHPAAGISATTTLLELYGNASSTGISSNFGFFGATATSTFTSTGALGIATSTPWGLLSISPSGITGPAFNVGSSTAIAFQVSQYGDVGGCVTQYGATGWPATSTAIVLDWPNTCNTIVLNMGTAAYTVTWKNATTTAMAGHRKFVQLCNPGSTGGAATLTNAEWSGTAPTLTTTANQCADYSIVIVPATSTPSGPSWKMLHADNGAFQ